MNRYASHQERTLARDGISSSARARVQQVPTREFYPQHWQCMHALMHQCICVYSIHSLKQRAADGASIVNLLIYVIDATPWSISAPCTALHARVSAIQRCNYSARMGSCTTQQTLKQQGCCYESMVLFRLSLARKEAPGQVPGPARTVVAAHT